MNKTFSIAKIWRNTSLQTKFVTLIMPLMLMSTIVFFTIFNIEANRTARTDLEKRMDKVAQIQASSISGPVWFVNFRQLELILKAMSNDPDFLGALVLDEENQVIRSVGELESPDGGFRIIEHPIEYSEFDDDAPRNIGLLRLAYSEKRLLQESSSRLKFASILAVLLTLSTVLSAIAALRYTVKVPLNQLLGAIRKTQETNEHVPILVNRGDEIGTLVNAYNELQKTQKEYETELQQARSGLEQRVEERTEDLLKREKQLSRVVAKLRKRETDLVGARDNAQDALTSLRGAQARLVQSEKMASLGQLTAGIAHEIKNPLNFVNNFARISKDLIEELVETLAGPIKNLKKPEQAEAEEIITTLVGNLEKINEHGQRADSIVKNMLAHSHDGPSHPAMTDINALCEEALGLVYHGFRAEKPGFNIELESKLAKKLPRCECHAQDILRVLINIMGNGMYAANIHNETQSGIEPTLLVETSLQDKDIRIDITDNGRGISKADKERIFAPFYTTKPAGEGTGLGLSLSFDIVVTQHGGQLSVESEPDSHTTFTIILPNRMSDQISGSGKSL